MTSADAPGLFERILRADTSPPRRVSTFSRATIVPASLEDTFAFFSDAANLERLTPAWLNFSIMTPSPMVMREGLEIEYCIRLYGVPIPWRSRIDVWEPGVRFTDRQLVGPYRWWHHEHRFESVDGGTRVIDELAYAPRASWISGGLVRRDVERIFDFRERTLARIFRQRSS